MGDVLFDSHVDIVGVGTSRGGIGDGDGIGAGIVSGNTWDKWIRFGRDIIVRACPCKRGVCGCRGGGQPKCVIDAWCVGGSGDRDGIPNGGHRGGIGQGTSIRVRHCDNV